MAHNRQKILSHFDTETNTKNSIYYNYNFLFFDIQNRISKAVSQWLHLYNFESILYFIANEL
jgi:hypothetical protein